MALYFVIGLLSQNIDQIAPGDATRSMLASLFFVTLSLIGARLLLGEWGRAALLATLLSIFFFSYGHVYALLKPVSAFGVLVARHRYLLSIWIVVLVGGWWVIKTLRQPRPILPALNFFGLLLLLMPLVQITSFQVRFWLAEGRLAEASSNEALLSSGTRSRPDIYYIILDAYTRDDTLLEVYSFDNAPFLRALEERGFFVARCSRSNYTRTSLSLSSSLNFDYLQQLSPRRDSAVIISLVKKSAIRRLLEERQYSIVTLDSGYYLTQWPDPEVYFRYPRGDDRLPGRTLGVNEFELIFIHTTAGMLLFESKIVIDGDPLASPAEAARLERFDRVHFILDTLASVPELPGPKFVFAHIPSPHEPYVFRADGRFAPGQNGGPAGYRGQVSYLNDRILSIVDTILADSPAPPIIILQGDHGGVETQADYRRLNILNAYFLPGIDRDVLYPSVTPVNTFRIILDSYFETQLGRLPDISYFSTPSEDFDFVEAPENRSECQNEGGLVISEIVK